MFDTKASNSYKSSSANEASTIKYTTGVERSGSTFAENFSYSVTDTTSSTSYNVVNEAITSEGTVTVIGSEGTVTVIGDIISAEYLASTSKGPVMNSKEFTSTKAKTNSVQTYVGVG